MTYDQWKCDSGYDDPPEEECFHEEYVTDWEGRATCERCGRSWWLTYEEVAAERDRSAAYDRYCRREERLEKWRQVRAWFRSFLPRRKPAPIDDDIPF
jgi:hypothetical protein